MSKYIFQFTFICQMLQNKYKNCPNTICPKLMQWSRINLDKLIANHLAKKFPITRPHPQPDVSTQTLTPYFCNTHFNTIFTYMCSSHMVECLEVFKQNFSCIFISPMCATDHDHSLFDFNFLQWILF